MERGRVATHPLSSHSPLSLHFTQNACTQPAGTCLANQLADLAAADAAREAAGKGPLYRLTRWGGGRPGARQAFRRAPGGPLWLGLPLPSATSSLLTLALDGSGLRVVTAVAAGAIESVSVCARPASGGGAGLLLPLPPNLAGCGAPASFQALSGAGALVVAIRNRGALAAQFTVAVANCTAGVLDPPAAVAALGPGGGGVVEFPLAATSGAGSGAAAGAGGRGGAACGVALLDAAGGVAAALTASFTINATEVAPPPVDPGGGGTGLGGGRSPTACAAACSQPGASWPARTACRLLRRCWADLLATVVAGLIVAGLVALLAVGCAKGWWWRLARACCGCCSSSRRGRGGGAGGRRRRAC